MKHLLPFLIAALFLIACHSKTKESARPAPVQSKIAPVAGTKVSDTQPATKVSLKDLSGFIPKGYALHAFKDGTFNEYDSITAGDLNKDGLPDLVLMIKATNKNNFVNDEYRGPLDRNRRGIIILFNKKDHYEIASKNYNCFSSENEDGGVYLPPELSPNIDKGNLYIDYGHGRYGNWTYTFRYQNGDFELIGYDRSVNRGPVPQYSISCNFITHKKQISDNINKDDDDDSNVVYKESWETLPAKKLLRLSEIKSFDQLDF